MSLLVYIGCVLGIGAAVILLLSWLEPRVTHECPPELEMKPVDHPQFAELAGAIRSLVEGGVPSKLEFAALKHEHEATIVYDGQLSASFGVPPHANRAAIEAHFAGYQLTGPFDCPLTNPFTKQPIPFLKYTLLLDRDVDQAASAALLILRMFGVPADATISIHRQ